MNTISVEHETTYDYAESVQQAHHLAYLKPCSNAYQTVLSQELSITPTPDTQHQDMDSFGNHRQFFSYQSPHQSLHVKSQCLIQTHPTPLAEVENAAIAWQEVRDLLSYSAGKPYLPASEFVFPSFYAPYVDEIKDFTLEIFNQCDNLIEASQQLCQRIYQDFTYSPDTTEINTPVLEAFTKRQGVCQDFSHIMISGLRSIGLSARYVSGYLLTKPSPGQEKMRGADASHAWVSIYCPSIPDHWLEIDPTNNVLAGSDHVRLAYGRDFGDVSPLRGVIRGGGEHQLSVAVTTERQEPSAS
jgi:transglutaminase-like putative cysteine protease